jgi:predicted PurR-regulated permease PerM
MTEKLNQEQRMETVGATGREASPAVPADTQPTAARTAWFSPRQLQWWGVLALTALAMFLCYLLVRPFGSALVWAVALAVLGNPVNQWLRKKIRSRAAAAGLAVIAVAVALTLPTALLAPRLVGEVIHGAETIKTAVENGTWRTHLERVKPAARFVRWLEEAANLKEVVQAGAKALATNLPAAARISVLGVAGLFISFFLLFYFFRDQEDALSLLKSLLPFSAKETEGLLRRVKDTIYAIVYGKLLTAAVQGLLGGIAFWFLGLPAAWFWGLLMALLSVVPVLGASVVWAPAAVFLALEGHWVKALILGIWGVAVVSLIDNVLYPMLVGQRLKVHNAAVFIAVLGGLVSFGPAGLFVGPAVLAVTVALLELWQRHAQSETPASV